MVVMSNVFSPRLSIHRKYDLKVKVVLSDRFPCLVPYVIVIVVLMLKGCAWRCLLRRHSYGRCVSMWTVVRCVADHVAL